MGPYTIAKYGRSVSCPGSPKSQSWDLTIVRPGLSGEPGSAIAGREAVLAEVYLLFGPFTRLPLCHATIAQTVWDLQPKPAASGERSSYIDGDEHSGLAALTSKRMRPDQFNVLHASVPYHVDGNRLNGLLLSAELCSGVMVKLPSC